MHTARFDTAVLAAAALLAVAGSAAAQDAGSNTVRLGQTGITNEVVIEQVGRDNVAGGDDEALHLQQDGDDNRLSIDQYGWSNSIGTSAFGGPRPGGVGQIGDGNEITVLQRNDAANGSNTVGAVFQRSSRSALSGINALEITQSEEGGGDPAAGHRVGSVVQNNPAADSDPNFARISQAGGGAGIGNGMESLWQQGSANLFELVQTGQSDSVGTVVQSGNENQSAIEQSGGEDNLVEFAFQYGTGNVMDVVLSGPRNALERVIQNNQLLGPGAEGNTLDVTIAGEDNGGSGAGGVGEFRTAEALALPVAQANVMQFGEGNDLGLTISGGNDNRFGYAQSGEGNGLVVAIGDEEAGTALRNESAAFQRGTDNNASHTVLGSDNVGAVRQEGDRNRVSLSQTGERNTIAADIFGDDNNRINSGFSGTVAPLAASEELAPGDILQDGLEHRVDVLVNGSRNLFAFSQEGDGHVAASSMSGRGNQLAVVQSGQRNVSLSSQTGNGNSLSTYQR